MGNSELRRFLLSKLEKYNQPSFIASDPISIPHSYARRQDIEIAGFFAAILAWGNRTSIINSCHRLMELMGNSPYAFIMQPDLANNQPAFDKLRGFVHRTFNGLDLWHLVLFLHHHFFTQKEESLESAFTLHLQANDENIKNALVGFHNYVFSFSEEAKLEMRCKKHIATPEHKSACKRLNMYLRWMVRNDERGVDFGIWKNIQPAQLVCPLDVHVANVSRKLGLLTRKQNDWEAAVELTQNLKKMNSQDPVIFDIALFALGVAEKY